MVSTKRLACPFCEVRLRVADTLPAGKIITCPKCGEGFPVPDPLTLPSPPATGGEGRVRGGNGRASAPKVSTAPSSYGFSTAEGASKVKGARTAAPPPDDGRGEETETPPKLRKRRKKAEQPA